MCSSPWLALANLYELPCLQAGVAATTITRLARTDDKAASSLSLDLASKIVTVLDCGIEDLLEAVELEDWIEIHLIDQIQRKERQMVLG